MSGEGGHPAPGGGPRLWRSLEDLVDSPAFRRRLEEEFPDLAERVERGFDRRDLLKLMGASFALAGMSGCDFRPDAYAVPSVHGYPERVPGETESYATTLTLNGYGRGVLVTTHTGRPVKIEGNPDHPASRGATDAFAQAEILSLYDRDRSSSVTENDRPSSWARLRQVLAGRGARARARGGEGLRLLTGPVTSPSLAHAITSLAEELPGARWHAHDPLASPGAREGSAYAFGRPVDTVARIADADVLLALDADILGPGPAQVIHAADFAARRRPDVEGGMNRLYSVETSPGLTGAAGDHRAPLRPAEIEALTRALLAELGLLGGGAAVEPPGVPWFASLVEDLRAHRDRALVLAGREQPPFIHAAAHALNDALGRLTTPIAPVAFDALHADTLAALVADIEAGEVETLLILDSNPLYTAPGDLDVEAALAAVPFTLHLGLYDDETAGACLWHAPMTHELESWGDARAFDGTISLRQPVVRPLVDARSPRAVLAMLREEEDAPEAELSRLRAYWEAYWPTDAPFQEVWRPALHDGVIGGTAARPLDVRLREGWHDAPGYSADAGGGARRLQAVFRPDPSVFDGRFANNAWLQELPKPLTKLTWDNVALVSPRTAEALGIESGVVLQIEDDAREIEAPAWVQPGHADGCLTLPLGYGRRRAGRLGAGAGFDAYPLRRRDALWLREAVSVAVTDRRVALATTQLHDVMQEDEHVRRATLAEFLKSPDFAADPERERPSLYPDYAYPGHAWGMSIDLNACIGCNACVVACQAENNTAVVGKDQVVLAREMHWLRIDRYYEGPPENPRTHFQPMLCMHCEKAPCEPVCPVHATVHGSEGLNEMIYNRCIGTRYCSNNCPYKVRRFNWYDYTAGPTARPRPANNPNVTVRSRGVMEKCTYCVQRINAARIAAQVEDRAIQDCELETACQQACPTRAIVFGDLNDSDSEVARRKRDPRDYGLLARLNTRPRTTYLAKVVNPADAEDDGKR